MHNDDNRWQTIFIEYFLYVYGNRQAVDGHGPNTTISRLVKSVAQIIRLTFLVGQHPHPVDRVVLRGQVGVHKLVAHAAAMSGAMAHERLDSRPGRRPYSGDFQPSTG